MNNLFKYNNFNSNFDLIDFAVPIIDLLSPIKYSPHQKYDNRYFLTCIINFIETGVSWSNYKGTINYPINGKYLNQIHNKYLKKGIYEEINKQLLTKYLNKNKAIKLKEQIIDSSFISNKAGYVNSQINNNLLSTKVKQKNKKILEKNKTLLSKKKIKQETFIDFNKYNGRKKYFKVSVLSDSYGTPITSTIISSKQSDNISINETIKTIPIDLNTLKNSSNNRYKQYLLADSSYHSNKNKSYLEKLGYTPIIKYNKRNTKKKEIILKTLLIKKKKKDTKKEELLNPSFHGLKIILLLIKIIKKQYILIKDYFY